MAEDLTNSRKYHQFVRRLEAGGSAIESIEPLEVVRKPNGEVLFAMLRLQATGPDGRPLPPVAVLRGDYAAVLVALYNREDGACRYLLVYQARTGSGAMELEHPAGMVDNEAEPSAVALRELWEETGFQARPEELIRLHTEPLFTSPGLLDEAGWLFAIERSLPRATIDALDGKQISAPDDNENIALAVLTPVEAKRRIRNANGRLHCFLYEAWKRGEPM